jgi:hypothetical protein
MWKPWTFFAVAVGGWMRPTLGKERKSSRINADGVFGRDRADVKECQALGGQVDPEFLKALRKASGRNE